MRSRRSGWIAAAQKVAPQISATDVARAGGSDGRPDGRRLARSLAEEEAADNLLTQIARELMGLARTGGSKAPTLVSVRED